MARRAERRDGRNRARWVVRRAFDGSFFAFAALAVAAAGTAWWLKGPAAFEHSVAESLDLLWFILPRVGAAMLIAAFLQVLIPRELVARLIGEQAGPRSVLIATLAGALTPGGPLTCFPIVVALHASGANKGALVAYLLSWAMMGVQRIFVWEFPLMGPDFTLLRVAASAALPVIAGLIALRLPIELRLPDQPPKRG